MNKLSKNQIKEIVKELENSIIRQECLTCDCFQGLLTQLELDCSEDISGLLDNLKTPTEKMHSCLGCNPCPGGALFVKYLKSKNNDSNTNIKELKQMATEKKKKGILKTIFESMTKTGGCCGGGGCCDGGDCDSSKEEDKKPAEKKNAK